LQNSTEHQPLNGEVHVQRADENAQLKAEVDGKETTKAQKFALQQKYGLSGVLDSDIDWYLSLDQQETKSWT
jgi:hypothetical protein